MRFVRICFANEFQFVFGFLILFHFKCSHCMYCPYFNSAFFSNTKLVCLFCLFVCLYDEHLIDNAKKSKKMCNMSLFTLVDLYLLNVFVVHVSILTFKQRD